MGTFKELIEAGEVGLTVYYPDALHSRLIAHLDHDIHAHTGLKIAYRHWFRHNMMSIMRFYTEDGEEVEDVPEDPRQTIDITNVPPEKLQTGHFATRHFTSGPCLLTLWQGPNAVETLLTHKGKTHPADSTPPAIRSRFWCDNAVCNLMHSSDKISEALRELKALGMAHVLDETPQPVALAPMAALDLSYLPHNSLSILAALFNRMQFDAVDGLPPLEAVVPASGEARATVQALAPLLKTAAGSLGDDHLYSRLIAAHLAGDLVTLTPLLKQVPVTEQEYFVIQCGTIGMEKWQTVLA